MNDEVVGQVKAELKKGKAKESGNEYFYVNITIADNVDKRVYLEQAELALVKMLLPKDNK